LLPISTALLATLCMDVSATVFIELSASSSIWYLQCKGEGWG
jgi:hypothetical protein